MSRVLLASLFAFALLAAACGSEEQSTAALDAQDTATQDVGTDAVGTDTAGDTAVSETATPDDTATQDTAADSSSDTNGADSATDTTSSDTTDQDVDVCAAVTGFVTGCGADANCVIGYHQLDCCGSLVAWGVNHAERDRFDTLEAACGATYQQCRCAQQPTRADDGSAGFDIAVRCVDGQCQTWARDAALCDAVGGYDKGCGADENCVIGLHQVDCCGSEIAVGLNHAQLTTFQADEAACRATLPTCDCPTQPTLAEDGNSGDATTIAVRCLAGSCQTWVP